MKKISLLVFCYIFSFFYSSYSYANSGVQDLHAQLIVVGDALNHQDFESAKVLWDTLLKSYTPDDIAKMTTYSDYLTYLQLFMWNWYTDLRNSIITLREKYHPEDGKRASFLTRKDRSVFWDSDCTSSHQAILDTIDYAHCILNTSKITSENKKKILFPLVPRYFMKVLKINDYQWMSDLSIFLSYYISSYPEKSLLAEKYQKQLAQKILKHDPHWVNAYFIMISISEKGTKKAYWIDELRKNYIWDSDQWKRVVEPFIASYQ